jgi:hypothetical protein
VLRGEWEEEHRPDGVSGVGQNVGEASDEKTKTPRSISCCGENEQRNQDDEEE